MWTGAGLNKWNNALWRRVAAWCTTKRAVLNAQPAFSAAEVQHFGAIDLNWRIVEFRTRRLKGEDYEMHKNLTDISSTRHCSKVKSLHQSQDELPLTHREETDSLVFIILLVLGEVVCREILSRATGKQGKSMKRLKQPQFLHYLSNGCWLSGCSGMFWCSESEPAPHTDSWSERVLEDRLHSQGAENCQLAVLWGIVKDGDISRLVGTCSEALPRFDPPQCFVWDCLGWLIQILCIF